MTLTLAHARELTNAPQGMNDTETKQVLELLVRAELSTEDGAGLISNWAKRGETGTELCATVQFLKERAVTVPVESPCFDLCGTGGSGLSRYNISTTVAFVAAAAGVPVAKHGNRGSKQPNGSFDLLDELGIPFELTPESEARLQKETGLCFLFARTHHPAVGKVVGYRKAAGCRSIFNLAGPLANPAAIKHQLIGTTNEKTAHILAEALGQLETEGALVVWGHPGIDEISVTGKTGYLQVSESQIKAGELMPTTKISLAYEELPGGNAKENSKIFYRLLSGAEKGPLLDMLVENAGVAIDLWNQRAPRLKGAGAEKARAVIRSGAALERFEQHRDLAQRLASH